MTSIALGCPTTPEWLSNVLKHFDEFLIDHAANEKKASSMALSLVAHYPDRQALTIAMIDLALEELNHFRQVVKILNDRGLTLGADEKDPYVNNLRGKIRKTSDEFFLDQLLCAAVIEARGEERFRLIGDSLTDSKLKRFYQTLANSEQGHHELFLSLAATYFPDDTIRARLENWLEFEQAAIESLPVRPRLH